MILHMDVENNTDVCMSTAKGNKNRGLADSISVYGKWNRTGYKGMLRFPLPAICPRSPRPPSLLLWMQQQLLYLPHP